MADLFLNWRDIAPSSFDDGDTASVETGGVAVDVSFGAQDADATAFTFSEDGYTEDTDGLNPNSWLKLYDEVNNDGDSPSSTLSMDFRATDTTLYTDQVQDVTFRLNDIDTRAVGGDLDEPDTAGFEDIVSVLAFDAEGNPVPVTLTAAGGVDVAGDTATGTSTTGFTDADGSVLVNITGPVARIEVVYENGDNASQAVTISDVNFTTVDVADNEPPVAVDDTAETPEDTAVIIDVLGNDSDPDGDLITVTGATVDIGTVVVNDDDTLTYTPPAGYDGPATITYTIEDPSGEEATGEVAVAVIPEDNLPPVAEEDVIETSEDDPVVIPVLGNDTDPEDDPLTVVAVSDPPNGDVVINDDGTVTYTPDPGFTGEDTFTYTVEDPSGNEDTAEVTVTVNSNPDAVDDADETPLDTPIVISVLDNDTDPESDPLEITDITDPANGTATENADGTITYTPDAGFSGEDTFDYTITDGNGGEDTATVTITVLPEDNLPPVAEEDVIETSEDDPVVIPVLGNDTDPEDDPLTVVAVSDPPNGDVVINDDGTVTYTPDPGFTGEDTFTYTVEDPSGNEDTAEVTVTVNSNPDAVDDADETPLDTPIVISVLDNDSDPESDPLEITDITDPANGTATENADGTITYTPDAGFSGEDTFDYTITDGNGGEDTATVTITVLPEEDLPPVAEDDTVMTTEDDPVIIPVRGNDSDPNGDPLTVTEVTEPTNGSAVINDDGTVTYTPDPGYTGPDSFTYTIEDPAGNEDTATVNVTVNSVPEAVDDEDTTPLDTPIVISVLDNDSDPESDPLTIVDTTDPSDGTIVVNGDGTITYTPDTGFTGEDTFSYVISDGNGGEDLAVVTVTVTPEGSVVAEDDADETLPSTPVVIDVLGNDSDPEGDDFTVAAVGDPSNGTAELNADGTVTYTPEAGFSGEDTFEYTIRDTDGNEDTATVTVVVNSDPVAEDDTDSTAPDTAVVIDVLGNDSDPEDDPLTVTEVSDPTNGDVVINDDGTVTYTPDDGFTGEDTFSYTIEDPLGGEDTAVVTVTVTPEGSVVAEDDADETLPSTPVVIDVLGNDSDPEGDDFTVAAVGDPSNGTAELNADGTVTYTPEAGFSGEDTFEYTIRDTDGNEDTATVTVVVNSDPVAEDDTDSTAPDTAVVIDVLGNDSDPEDDPLTVTEVSDPTNGDVVINDDGTVTYTPDDGFTGEDTFSYTIEDPLGGEDTAVVTVTVSDNSAPDAVDDEESTAPETPIVIDVLGNDTDPEDDDLTVTSITQPDEGTAVLNPDGTVTYTPDADHSGEDTFSYTITDGNGGEDTAVVTVTVDGNRPPEAVDDAVFTDPLEPVIVTPLANDSDPDEDPLTVTGIGTPTHGTAVLNDDGTVTYTPGTVGSGDDTFPFLGEDTIPYTISDGEGGTDTGEIVITVGGRIDADIFPVDDTLQPLDPFNGLDEDPDPENDRDSIDGTSGEDTIVTGDDDDTINAGGGDDIVRPGIDDDLVSLGGGDDSLVDVQGADTVTGGEGDDTIIAGFDTFSDYPGDDDFFPFLGFGADPNTDDGRDSIQGNNGNDVIFTGDDDDTIDGGQDNDTIDAGIDDDLVQGGQGDDSIIGGHGSDTLDGGQGDDFIDGSNIDELEIPDDTDTVPENDRDSINGALGDDTLLGGDDDDTLIGGSGNDSLDGGIDEDLLLGGGDDDTLIGGDGADTLDGGDGDDSIDGGDGRDTIIIGSAAQGNNDTVDGGSGVLDPEDPTESNPDNGDWDVLDLTAVGRPDGENPAWRLINETEDSNGNGINGTIQFLDGDGDVTGSFDFFEIEEIVPCFTPGTLIATPQGERLVEDLKVGDRIITRDNGIQEIRWMGQKEVSGTELARKPHLKPILIRKGALGKGLPEHDTLVSPNHRVLVANDKTALYFEEREVLVAAKHLTGLDGVDEVESTGVTYIHFMFDQHEVVLSNGAWTESFQPGDYTLKGIGNAQRQEIFELFPELEHAEGLRAYGAARRSLKKHEAQLLTSS